jgi:hypothetical protein
VRPVSDALLLDVASTSATLLGLLVVGVFFYVETGLRRLEHAHDVFAPYVRAAARLTMGLYLVALTTALALVALEPGWARAVFGVTALAVLASLVEFTRRARAMGKLIGTAGWSRSQELLIWTCVAAALIMPWVLGVAAPNREDLTWGVLLALVLGLLSTLSMLLSAFDIAKFESAVRRTSDG